MSSVDPSAVETRICTAHTLWYCCGDPGLQHRTLPHKFPKALEQALYGRCYVPRLFLASFYSFKHPFRWKNHPEMMLAPIQQRATPKAILLVIRSTAAHSLYFERDTVLCQYPKDQPKECKPLPPQPTMLFILIFTDKLIFLPMQAVATSDRWVP